MAAANCVSATCKPIQTGGISTTSLPDDLNGFFTSFETDNSTQLRSITSTLGAADPVLISSAEVVRGLQMTKTNTAPGPDYVCGHILRQCAEQLGVFQHVFQLQSPCNMETFHSVPPSTKWDTSKGLKPVALTSLVMKAMERIMKNHLIGVTDLMLDPPQFAS